MIKREIHIIIDGEWPERGIRSLAQHIRSTMKQRGWRNFVVNVVDDGKIKVTYGVTQAFAKAP